MLVRLSEANEQAYRFFEWWLKDGPDQSHAGIAPVDPPLDSAASVPRRGNSIGLGCREQFQRLGDFVPQRQQMDWVLEVIIEEVFTPCTAIIAGSRLGALGRISEASLDILRCDVVVFL